MDMWHVTQKMILLVDLFLKGITQRRGGQGDNHKVRGWGKSMLPVRSYLVWEGGLDRDSRGVIAGIGVEGWQRRHAPRRMPSMID